MTSATLQLPAPTRLERGLQHLAASLSRYVEHRITARAERREVALGLLRGQHSHRHDPRALDIALLSLGSRPR